MLRFGVTEQFTLLSYAAGDPENIAGGRVKQLAKHPDGSIWAVMFIADYLPL